MKRWILIAWALTLAVAGAGVIGKERLLARGDVVLLRLAPVDPRSLMQGDYMALNFAIGAPILRALETTDDRIRTAVVRLDAGGEASFVRLHRGEPLVAGEHLLRFQLRPSRWGTDQVQISTDAFFFQEGQARRYEGAQFGAFRVDAQGQALLVELRDAEGHPL